MAYKLTALGESRARRIDRAFDPEGAIIALLYERGDALEVEEIAGETRMDEETAVRVLNRLVNAKKYLKEV